MRPPPGSEDNGLNQVAFGAIKMVITHQLTSLRNDVVSVDTRSQHNARSIGFKLLQAVFE